MTCETTDAGTLDTCANLLAGHALFTILHNESGTRFTYHFYAAKTGKCKGVIQARLLTGPQNTSDYTEIGTIDPATGAVTLTGKIGTGEKGKNSVPESVALLRWVAKLAADKSPVPAGLTVHHAGHCLRCGRVLTVPYPANPYRIYGLGPECGGK